MKIINKVRFSCTTQLDFQCFVLNFDDCFNQYLMLNGV